VCFDFPAYPHVAAGFSDPLPTEPIVLAVPSHGWLALSFEDASGKALLAPVQYYQLQVQFADEAVPSGDFPPGQRRLTSGFREAGEHVLELPIGLGARISTSGQFQPLGEIEEASFMGPQTSGEKVTHAFRLKSNFSVIRGRQANSEENSPEHISMRAVLIRGMEQLSAHKPTVAPDGLFELIVRTSQPRPSTIYLHVRRTDGREAGRELSLPRANIVDLGLVELEPLPSPVQGSVVDDLGRPIAGAEIQAWYQDQGKWTRDLRFQTSSDGDGAFQLLTPGNTLGLGLLARRRGHLMREPIQLQASQPLEMMRSAEISGSLRVPEWVRGSTLSVQAEAVTGTEPAIAVHPNARDGVATFRLPNLWPGRYRLHLQLNDEPQPFRDLGVYDVEPGEASAADRLRGIDLRANLFRIELAITDASGKRLDLPGAGVHALIPLADGTVHKQIVRWNGAGTQLVCSHQSLRIEFVARGYETWRGTVHAGPNVLQLERER
jgi:hypothetical protein